VLRLGDTSTTKPASSKGRRQARLGGFDLHANTSVRAKNRPKLERLCRYLLRPPSCFRTPSAEFSVISVFPQTQSSSHPPGHPLSSTMPGPVDHARLRARAIGELHPLGLDDAVSGASGCKHSARTPFVCRFLSPSGSSKAPKCAVLDVMSPGASRREGLCFDYQAQVVSLTAHPLRPYGPDARVARAGPGNG
jgi:hypothetical protein